MQETFFNTLAKTGVIPVLVLDSADLAVPTAEALHNGGIPIAEITMRTPAAAKSIELIAAHYSQVVVGAGTVLSVDMAIQAVHAGAKFLVSPGMDEELVIWALERDVPILCGAVTPSEIMQGLRLSLTTFKFFPSAAMGGLATIRAVSDPFPKIRFIPTGGINQNNLVDYLSHERVLAVGGSWMATRQMITEKRFQEITELASQASTTVKSVRESQQS